MHMLVRHAHLPHGRARLAERGEGGEGRATFPLGKEPKYSPPIFFAFFEESKILPLYFFAFFEEPIISPPSFLRFFKEPKILAPLEAEKAYAYGVLPHPTAATHTHPMGGRAWRRGGEGGEAIAYGVLAGYALEKNPKKSTP